MVESRYPNRFFGSNPQAMTGSGRQLTPFHKELPKDWRSALGAAAQDEADAKEAAQAAAMDAPEGNASSS
jgi:hypothetical protein